MTTDGLDRSSEQRGRIFVVYATAQHQTERTAVAVSERLREHGFVVEVGDARTGGMPPPEDYDGIVLGASAGFGHESQLVATYIDHNRVGLADVPCALFTVTTSGVVRDLAPGGFLDNLVSVLGWSPDLAASFEEGDPTPREGVMTTIAHAESWPLRHVPHVQWTDIRRFADSFASLVASDAVAAPRTQPQIDERSPR